MKTLGIYTFLGLAWLAAAGAWAAEPGGGSIYTCVDASGRKLTSDRPIAACTDRTQRELGPTGSTRRVIGPTLTEDERAQHAARARKEQDERDRVLEDRRRERVLLARYPNKAAHDVERQAALGTSASLMQMVRLRQNDLNDRRKALEAEMEFYKRDPSKAPLHLRRDVAQNQSDLQSQERQIAEQASEKKRVNDRFDRELAQLRRLWAERETATGSVSGAGH